MAWNRAATCGAGHDAGGVVLDIESHALVETQRSPLLTTVPMP
jgi:hypothetical protein